MLARVFEFLDRHFHSAALTGWFTTVGTSSLAELETVNLVLRIVLDVFGILIGALTLLITWRKFRAR